MKLFARYNSLSLTASILVFGLGIAALYFLVWHILIQQLDSSLLGEREKIIQYVNSKKELPETVRVYDQRTVFEEEPESYIKFKFRTKYKEADSGEDELVRAIYFGVDVNGRHYKVTVIRPLDETKQLLLYIFLVALATIALLIGASFIINRIVVKRLLRPFYSSLSSLENFSITEQKPLLLSKTSIYEFELLNQKLEEFTKRIRDDYSVLKDFTGYAAHEMQTPLSIIRNNIDNLLQGEHLSEGQANALEEMDETVRKLSRLNQSLLLMAKLESNAFVETSPVRIDVLAKRKLDQLSEIAESQEIEITTSLQSLNKQMNEHLAEIIVNNLLSNAIRFNRRGGRLVVETSESVLQVKNTSELPPLEAEHIFNRFYRHPLSKADGTGLGLAMAKQAATIAGLQVEYTFEDGLHVFRVDFSGRSNGL